MEPPIRQSTCPSDALRSVGMQLNGLDFKLSLLLGQVLRERHGSAVHIYVRSERECRGIRRMADAELPPGTIASVAVAQRIEARLPDPVADETAVFDRARDWERRIGETYNQILLDHRQLSRGHIPGGGGIPASLPVVAASYPQTVQALNKVLDFWEGEIRSKRLTLMLNAEKWVVCVFRALGIPYRRRCMARYENLQYWSPDEYFTDPFRKPCYDALAEWPPIEEALRYQGQVSKNRANISTHSYASILPNILRGVAEDAYRRLTGEPPVIGLADTIRMNFRPRRGFREYHRLKTVTVEYLRGRDFVYFPLHKEPETDFVAASPEFLNQLNAISSLSRDLPAGVVLAVKEHIPAFGLRPDGFYRQLSFLKNLVFVDALESSIELIKAAKATATIAGTAGLEASILGRPVIQFGRHSLNHFLDHVFTVYCEDDVRVYLRRILGGTVDLAQARKDGARFLEATKRSSFDMGEFLVSTGHGRGASRENAETLYHGLLRSLEGDVRSDRDWIPPIAYGAAGGE